MTKEEATELYFMCRRLLNKYKSSSPEMMAQVWEKMIGDWFENLPKVALLGVPLWILSPFKALILLFDADAKPNFKDMGKSQGGKMQ